MTDARKKLVRWKFRQLLELLPEPLYDGDEFALLCILFEHEVTQRAKRQAEREGWLPYTLVGERWFKG